MEKAVLQTPIIRANVTSYEIAWVELRRLPDWHLSIGYVDDAGETHVFGADGNEAKIPIRLLNTVDLSVKSLERRALEYLMTKGLIATASVAGTPEE